MSAIGETSLKALLSTLSATLDPKTYVFATMAKTEPFPLSLINDCKMLFQESEGATLILPLSVAQQNKIEYTFPSKMITLDVHSSLEAVGFMAVVATRLKELGMGVNPVSAYFHDHLFIPEGRENEAMEMLKKLAEESKGD